MYTLTLLKSFGFFMTGSWAQNILLMQFFKFSDKIYNVYSHFVKTHLKQQSNHLILRKL
jgi:hypothetical protein